MKFILMKHFDYQYFPTLTTLGNHRCRAEVPTHGRNKKGKMPNKSAILGRGYPPITAFCGGAVAGRFC